MKGVKDVQGGYVRARPQGLYGRGHEHPPRRPKLEPYTGVIDRILE